MTSDAYNRAEAIRADLAVFQPVDIRNRSREALAAYEWSTKATYIDRADMLARLRTANVARCVQSYHDVENMSPLEWGACAAGEMGELLQLLKRAHDMHRPASLQVTNGEIADEIADTIIYLDLIAFLYRINVERAIQRKFNAVSDRIGSDVKL